MVRSALNWERLPELEQFDLISRPDSEHRFMAVMNLAYCDESADPRSPPVYSVSGYLGRGPDWYELGRKWRRALAEEHLEADGFHMSKCEAGLEPPYQVSRDQRDYWQRKFIGIINETPLWGRAVCIETEPYLDLNAKTDATVRARRGDYAKPYYLAFQHAVESMAEVLERNDFPKGECITFVFDQQKEYQGKAKALYYSLQQDRRLSYTHRLGALTFDSRLAQEQLQAADILAYESMRFFRETKMKGQAKTRWQYDLLRSVRGPRTLELAYFDRAALNKLAKRVGWLDQDHPGI